MLKLVEIEKEKKHNKIKQTTHLEEINQKLVAKEGRRKRYRDRVKQYRQNRTFLKNEKKFYQEVGRKCMKTYQQPDAK